MKKEKKQKATSSSFHTQGVRKQSCATRRLRARSTYFDFDFVFVYILRQYERVMVQYMSTENRQSIDIEIDLKMAIAQLLLTFDSACN
jgi:hypothetical protein